MDEGPAFPKYLEQLCVPIDRCLVSCRSNCVYRGRTLELRNSNTWKNQRTKVWIQTKVLDFQIDNEVEQVIDPNRNQMEQNKGLEVIKSRDMEVGLSRGQPWKRNPMNPINLRVGVTKTLIRLQFGLKIKVKEAVPNCLTSK